MGIARSSFYADTAPVTDDTALVEAMHAIKDEFEAYGWRRMQAALRQDGWVVNHKKIKRLMREHGLQPPLRRRFVATTDSDHDQPIFPNRSRELLVGGPNQLWVADLTYVAIAVGFVYVAVIMDAWSRRIVGFAIGRRIDARLTLAALGGAVAARKPPAGCIRHSDRGSQYAAQAYRDALDGAGLVGSMGRRGIPTITQSREPDEDAEGRGRLALHRVRPPRHGGDVIPVAPRVPGTGPELVGPGTESLGCASEIAKASRTAETMTRICTIRGSETALNRATLETFENGLRGTVLRPGEAGYDEARSLWNGMIDRHPALIIRAQGAADVADTVRLAATHDLLLAVRGGGHNIAGSAICDGGLMLDLSPMKGIHVDPTTETARVEPGCLWSEVDRETQPFGLTVPSGVVSTTGVAGLTLGGGFGCLRS